MPILYYLAKAAKAKVCAGTYAPPAVQEPSTAETFQHSKSDSVPAENSNKSLDTSTKDETPPATKLIAKKSETCAMC